MSLSDFTIISKLGEGSYSSVHKVKRKSDGKEYALKKVRLLSLKQKQKQNSLNEVRILASVTSPYIISYKDAFIDEGGNSLCVIMEYADGGDLQVTYSFSTEVITLILLNTQQQKIEAKIRKNQSFPEAEVWKVARHVLSGLKVLHDMDILHRDLKSANIFITGDTYKLGDLNVSKLAKRGLAYTQTGTPYYASPEVWRDQPYDSKSDIWSFGCALYQMCAMKPPFQARNMEELYKRVQKGVFQRIPRRYSDELQNFIQICLQLIPGRRPSCNDLLRMPQFSEYGESAPEASNNLIDTIKLPKNLNYLNSMLPKNKYQLSKTNYTRHSTQQSLNRVPSRKSNPTEKEANHRVRYMLRKNPTEKASIPHELKQQGHYRDPEITSLPPINPAPHLPVVKQRPADILDSHKQYYTRDVSRNNDILAMLREKEKQRQALLEDKIAPPRQVTYQEQQLRDRVSLRERNLMGNAIAGEYRGYVKNQPQSRENRFDSKLPPVGIKSLPDGMQQQQAYSYAKPSWWG